VVDYSLYIHLPFCSKKCDYCHFFVLPDHEVYKDQLLKGLKQEWQLVQPLTEGKNLVSVYFGGGTPSLFGPDRIEELLNLWECKGEITLEANPENLSPEMMRRYAKAGINRVSLGVQSFDDELLTRLSRTHNTQKAKEVVWELAEWIPNISIDLMYDIPTQTLDQWESTLEQIVFLPIQHISLYNLTIEPHTVFYKYRQELKKTVPNEKSSFQMYQRAVETFSIAGFHQYEISAFCLGGRESCHNSGYWTGRPFLGLGPSAFGYWDNTRMRNVAHLNKYCQALDAGKRPIDFHERLEPEAQNRERLVIALRMLKGVDIKEFPTLEKEAQNLVQQGLLRKSGSHIQLTQMGILHYDSIAIELI